MDIFHKHTHLLIISALLGLISVPWLENSALGQNNPDPKLSNAATYPVAPPPKRVDPLPDERDVLERETETDYRISNLLKDFSGNLWVGSWRGLSRIDPNTGNIIARVSLPNVTRLFDPSAEK
ncbi:MAG: transcriptional regulator, partial [Sphaerospermopsis kisseleviana]